MGRIGWDGGPQNQKAAIGLSASLEENGIHLRRLQTATPPRVLKSSVDLSRLAELPGDIDAGGFTWEDRLRRYENQISCFLTFTDESSIAANAYRILNGEELISNDTDFNIINVTSEDEAVNNVFECFDKYKDTDMVILSPTKQNVMGTISLNKEIQGIAARIGAESLSVGTSSVYREYDKVMQIKNDYNIQFFDESTNEVSTGVYNGEIGEITKISEINKTIEVVFDDGKKVLYEGKTLEDIDLAYAMTVHKAQGCEFDTVVIALGKMSYHLLNRKLLYTAVTRGKKKVIIINFNNALKRMIKSVDVNKRQTSLTDFVQIIDKKRGI